MNAAAAAHAAPHLQRAGGQRVGHATQQRARALRPQDPAKERSDAAAGRAWLLLPDSDEVQRLPGDHAAGAADAACRGGVQRCDGRCLSFYAAAAGSMHGVRVSIGWARRARWLPTLPPRKASRHRRQAAAAAAAAGAAADRRRSLPLPAWGRRWH